MHNPEAGGSAPSKATLLDALAAAGYRARYRSTKADGWKRALESPGDLVVIAGGDGTVAKVARRLAGCGIPIAVLPVGTANNIARTLGLHGSIESLIARWTSARLVPLDLGIARGPWGEKLFVEAIGLGLFANLLSAADEKAHRERAKSLGPREQARRASRYMRKALLAETACRWTVRIDGRDIVDEGVMLEVMNIRAIGSGLELAPQADPGDGWLDVVFVHASERDAFADFLAARADGAAPPPPVGAVRARRVEIAEGYGMVHLDDDPWPDPDDEGSNDRSAARGPVEVTLAAHALDVLL
jgi:diacylglycerol kinase (ATP)